jgi:acyl carrier protein
MTTTACTIEEIAERLELRLPRLHLGADPDVRVADLGLDSMDTVELLCVSHEEFGLRLTESDFNPRQTVTGLLSAIVRHLNQ